MLTKMTCNISTKIYRIMSNTPLRRGKAWEEEEIKSLLQEVHDNKSHDEIATAHERTPCGVRAQLRKLAAHYYINENRSFEEISHLTGLTIQAIQWGIDKYAQKPVSTQPRTKTVKKVQNDPRTDKDQHMIKLLEEIRDLLTVLVSRGPLFKN
jgi:hypothetical protein